MSLPRDFVERLKSAGGPFFGGSAAYVPLTSGELDNRLNNAIIASMIVHMFLIFGLTFKAANPALFQNNQSIEVVLVNARSQTQPLNAEALAQYNLDGGGDVEEDRQAKSHLVASDRDTPPSAQQLESRIRELETRAKQLMAQAKSNYATQPERKDPANQPRPQVQAPLDLAEASLEMARLQARISDEYDAYQKRPRRAFVGARAQEYSFARYVEDWRIKVERIGNLNYPEAAKREGIHGSLVLTVNIKADGSLEDIQIDRSSGSRILDAAAIKIVQMSAPFAPFTEAMREKVDILSVTRAWQFTTSDQLLSK